MNKKPYHSPRLVCYSDVVTQAYIDFVNAYVGWAMNVWGCMEVVIDDFLDKVEKIELTIKPPGGNGTVKPS